MEGREERLSSGSRPPSIVLLNSTTPTQGISEVRDPKSHMKVLKKSSGTVLYTSITYLLPKFYLSYH